MARGWGNRGRRAICRINGTSRLAFQRLACGHDEVPLVGVVDACDTHDRVRSDVWVTTGAQKSLAFCVAALRQVFRAAAVMLRWTHPENTVVDGMTQEMDVLHLCRIVLGGVWSIEYEPSMMKASREALKHAEKAQAASALCAE